MGKSIDVRFHSDVLRVVAFNNPGLRRYGPAFRSLLNSVVIAKVSSGEYRVPPDDWVAPGADESPDSGAGGLAAVAVPRPITFDEMCDAWLKYRSGVGAEELRELQNCRLRHDRSIEMCHDGRLFAVNYRVWKDPVDGGLPRSYRVAQSWAVGDAQRAYMRSVYESGVPILLALDASRGTFGVDYEVRPIYLVRYVPQLVVSLDATYGAKDRPCEFRIPMGQVVTHDRPGANQFYDAHPELRGKVEYRVVGQFHWASGRAAVC